MKKLLMIMILGMFLISLASAEINNYAPVKTNECKLITQVCASCTYVNISISYPNSTLAITNQGMTSVGGGTWTYNFCNTTLIGRYDITGEGDISGTPTGFDVLWFEVSSSGELTSTSQGYLIIGQLGLIALLFVIAFSFSKDKWKLRSLFFMASLFMGIILLNSIRIMSGASNSLNEMGEAGLILGIIVLIFMFLWLLINYLIEVFKYFKEKRRMKWEVNEQT